MKRQQKISIVIVSVVTLAFILLAAYYSDFLGARFIRKGSPRLTVRQGEINTLELSPSGKTRKLEICTEKRNIILGRSDFVECRSLKDFVAPGTTEAAVIIPVNMPLGRAIVITRIRNDNGTLAPLAPTDEKITLYIVPPRGSILTAGRDSSGGTGGGSGGTGGGGGAGSGGGTTTPTPSGAQKSPLPSAQPSPVQTIIIPSTSPKVTPSPIFASPSPSPTSYISCFTPGLPEIAISGTPKAELVITNVALSPAYMVSGTPATVTIDIKNIGPAAASKFYVEILYDKYYNGLYDPHTGSSHNTDYSNLYAKYFEIGSLGSEQTTRITHTITNTFYSSNPPVNTGTHGIIVGVDIHRENPTLSDLVPEYDSSNASNSGSCTFKPNL